MNRKTYLQLIFVFSFIMITLLCLQMGTGINIFTPSLLISFVILMEIIHAVRRKKVRGKWFFNLFSTSDFITDWQLRFSKDDK
jgi:uncharacterized membrane protein